jgi:hypothetical protein
MVFALRLLLPKQGVQCLQEGFLSFPKRKRDTQCSDSRPARATHYKCDRTRNCQTRTSHDGQLISYSQQHFQDRICRHLKRRRSYLILNPSQFFGDCIQFCYGVSSRIDPQKSNYLGRFVNTLRQLVALLSRRRLHRRDRCARRARSGIESVLNSGHKSIDGLLITYSRRRLLKGISKETKFFSIYRHDKIFFSDQYSGQKGGVSYTELVVTTRGQLCEVSDD